MPSRVEALAVGSPIFGLVCWTTEEGRSLALYCGGGGSAKSGVTNHVRVVDLADMSTVWSFDTGEELASAACRGGSEIVVCFGAKLRSFDLELNSKRGEVVADTEECVNSIDIAYDGLSLASGGDDGVVRLWILDEDETSIFRKDRDCRGHEGPVTSVSYADAAHLVASASKDGTCRVWSATLGTCFAKVDVRAVTPVIALKTKRLGGPKPGDVMCRSAKFVDRDLAIVVASCPQRGAAFASKWQLNVEGDKVTLDLRALQKVSSKPVSSVARKDAHLAFGDVDGNVTLLNVVAAEKNKNLLKPLFTRRALHDLPVTALSFASDELLVSASADYKINKIRTPATSKKGGRTSGLCGRLFTLLFYVLLGYVVFLKYDDIKLVVSDQLRERRDVAALLASYFQDNTHDNTALLRDDDDDGSLPSVTSEEEPGEDRYPSVEDALPSDDYDGGYEDDEQQEAEEEEPPEEEEEEPFTQPPPEEDGYEDEQQHEEEPPEEEEEEEPLTQPPPEEDGYEDEQQHEEEPPEEEEEEEPLTQPPPEEDGYEDEQQYEEEPPEEEAEEEPLPPPPPEEEEEEEDGEAEEPREEL